MSSQVYKPTVEVGQGTRLMNVFIWFSQFVNNCQQCRKKVNELPCPQENAVQVQEGWLPPLLKAVTENPTTIASTVTSDHLGLYQYRMCWQSPHSLDNNLLKAVNGVPRYHPSVRQTFCAMLCPCLMVFLSLGKRTNKTIFDQLLIHLA